VTAMARLAASEPVIPVLPEALDTDPWLLNCQNCTLDLRRNAPTLVRPHTKADLYSARPGLTQIVVGCAWG